MSTKSTYAHLRVCDSEGQPVYDVAHIAAVVSGRAPDRIAELEAGLREIRSLNSTIGCPDARQTCAIVDRLLTDQQQQDKIT